MDASTYSIVSRGEPLQGFEWEQVLHAFAQTFKITPEKARGFVESERTLKKDLDHKTAYTYKQKLEGIGLKVELKRHAAKASTEALSLSIAPIAESQENAPSSAPLTMMAENAVERSVANPSRGNANTNLIVCPKCSLEQEKKEQCAGCGVYMHKVKAALENNRDDSIHHEEESSSAFNPFALVVAAVVALIGALIWKFIAVEFGYEYGIVAWIIGGAVGGAVALTGAAGQSTALACALFSCFAIFGGKYMAITGLQAEFTQSLFELQDEADSGGVGSLRDVYLEELDDARIFSQTVTNDQTLETFMLNRGYVEHYDSTQVSAEDMAAFKSFTQPRIEWISEETPSFDEWSSHYFDHIEGLSTIDLMKADFEMLDLLFLFLGMVTAFRLGRGQG